MEKPNKPTQKQGGDYMQKDLVLSVDCGTQSIRAIIFDDSGNLLAKVKKELAPPYFSVKPNYAEQNVNYFWDTICCVCTELSEKEPKLWKRISAISVTTIRDSYVCLDKDLNPLRPMILWLDQRKAPINYKKDMPFINRLLFGLVGMKNAVIRQMEKGSVNWIMREEKEIWDKTYKFLSYGGYINYKLTGCLIDGIAQNIGHVPFDYKNQRWASDRDLKRPMFNVPLEKLAPLTESGKIIGYVTQEASKLTNLPEGLPVVMSGSDKGCETLAVGCVDDTSASLSFGTTATVQTTVSKYVEPIKFMPSYPAIMNGRFNPEVEIFRGYWMVSWFKEQFAKNEESIAREKGMSLEQLLDEELSTIPAGANGLILQPFWTPGLKEPEGKGTIIGFTDTHTRAHIYRAIIEGIGFGLMEGLYAMEKKAKIRTKYVTVSGGGSSSDTICQITADMFGLPVRRVQTYETSGLGAAMMSYIGIGKYNSPEEAVNAMVHYKDEFIPNMENHKLYIDVYNKVYSKLYKSVKPLYITLKDVEGLN